MILELEKQNIHMNRWKKQVSTQVTLDDDFIVPDTMSDIAQVILSSGEIQLEPAKVQSEKLSLRGRLDFHILYRKEEGGMQTLGGMLPFEDSVNVPDLEEQDYVSVHGRLEDLHADIIHSRKLSIKAIITLEIRVETLFDSEAAVDIAAGGVNASDKMAPRIEIRKKERSVAAIALRRKDTYRVKEEISLSGTKPAIDRILWTEMRLTGVTVRPLDGNIHLDGSLLIFVIYEGEGDPNLVQWIEQSLPFTGEVEMQGATADMIPAISVCLIHKELEARPDYDGEMRELGIDAVVELDVRLYEEQELAIVEDLYAANREVELETGEAQFDRILTRNTGKCRIAEKISLDRGERILQVCHSSGIARIDEAVPGEDILSIDGVLELQILYLTDNDRQPIQSTTEMVPFHYEAEVPGICVDSVWHLETGLEQLTVALTGGDTAEVRSVVTLELLVLEPERCTIVLKAEILPLDITKWQAIPGIVGYVVQPGDLLWDIAKRFHTTMDAIITTNNLPSETVHPGDSLILVKEAGR